MQDNPILVEVTRGSLVESCHRGSVAIADADGRAANRLQLTTSDPVAKPIRLGSAGDTSNFLSAMKVLGVPAAGTRKATN